MSWPRPLGFVGELSVYQTHLVPHLAFTDPKPRATTCQDQLEAHSTHPRSHHGPRTPAGRQAKSTIAIARSADDPTSIGELPAQRPCSVNPPALRPQFANLSVRTSPSPSPVAVPHLIQSSPGALLHTTTAQQKSFNMAKKGNRLHPHPCVCNHCFVFPKRKAIQWENRKPKTEDDSC